MNVLQQHQLKHRTAYPPQGGSTNSPAPTAVTTNQTSSSKRETLSVVPLLDDSPAGSTVQTTSQKLRRGNAACEDEEVLTADVAQQDFIRWLMISGTNNHDSFQLIDHTMLSPMVRRGIPEPLRGGVWKKMLMSRNASATNHTWLYQSLLEVRECPCRGDIFRDISRTFPRHALFRERASPGQSALLNVLCAYSLRNPAVGYCQGMGFVVGFILSFMTEEDTFYFLDALLSKMEISDLYTPGLPLLESYFNLFRELLKIEMPTLSCHLEDENVDVSMYSSQWFMTIFTYNLNFNVVERIWDIFIFEGAKTLFKFALAVLKLLEGKLLSSPFEQILNVLKVEPAKMDINHLMDVALAMTLDKGILEKFGVK